MAAVAHQRSTQPRRPAQADFAELLGVSVRTLQDWEQGRRNPSGAAKTLLRVAILHPETLRDLPPWHADDTNTTVN